MKIFCIGFQKTGTSSMGAALRSLGYEVIGARGAKDPRIAETAFEMIRELVPLYDAFQDNPWALLYKELDVLYPNSKFILTVRDPDSWLRSAVGYFANSTTPMREWIYGSGDPIGHEQEWRERYERHNREAREYFRGREGKDYLEMNLGKRDGWEQLCPFLGVPIVRDRPFPKRNTKEQNRQNRRFTARARRAWKKLQRSIGVDLRTNPRGSSLPQAETERVFDRRAGSMEEEGASMGLKK